MVNLGCPPSVASTAAALVCCEHSSANVGGKTAAAGWVAASEQLGEASLERQADVRSFVASFSLASPEVAHVFGVVRAPF